MQTEALTAIIGLCITAAAAIGRGVVTAIQWRKKQNKTVDKIRELKTAITTSEKLVEDPAWLTVTDICQAITTAAEKAKKPSGIESTYRVMTIGAQRTRYETVYVGSLSAECSTVYQFVSAMYATLHALQMTLLSELSGTQGHDLRSAELRVAASHLRLPVTTITASKTSLGLLDVSIGSALRRGSAIHENLDMRYADENDIAMAIMRRWEASDARGGAEPARIWLHATGLTCVHLLCASDEAFTAAIVCTPTGSDHASPQSRARQPDQAGIGELLLRLYNGDWAFALLVDDTGAVVSATSTQRNATYVGRVIGKQVDAFVRGGEWRADGSISISQYMVSQGTIVFLASHEAGSPRPRYIGSPNASLGSHEVCDGVVRGVHKRLRCQTPKGGGADGVVPEPEDSGERRNG
jgi:hypothetical protein